MAHINCYGKCKCGNGIYESGMYSCNDCIDKKLNKMVEEANHPFNFITLADMREIYDEWVSLKEKQNTEDRRTHTKTKQIGDLQYGGHRIDYD